MQENLNELGPYTNSRETSSKKQEADPRLDLKKEYGMNDRAIRFLQFVDTYGNGIVTISPGVSYSMRDVLIQSSLERNFTFPVPFYADGEEKLFFSLPYIIADAIYKHTDIDTKDIQIKTDNLNAQEWTPLLKGAVANYLKTTFYGSKLNDFRKELIDMGEITVKEVNNESYIVQQLHIIRPEHIKDLQKSGLAERTLLTWQDMLENKEAWKDQWDEIERLKLIMDSLQKKTFIVYEWHTLDKFEKDGEARETKGCIKFLDCNIYEEYQSDSPFNWEPYVELEAFAAPDEVPVTSKKRLNALIEAGYLKKGDTKEPVFPYETQSLIEVPGRARGMGMYELLRPETTAFVETLNEKRRYDQLVHKGVIVHKKAPFAINQKGSGRSIEADVISKLQTGTMISIKAGESLDRLNLGTLTADFIQSAEKWFDIARRKAGVSDFATGEKLPSSMPATVGVINQQSNKTAFDVVNEQQALFLERLFTKFKLRSIINELKEEDWVKLIGNPDELQQMEESFIENLINVAIPQAVAEGQIIPEGSELAPEQYNQIKEAVRTVRGKQGGERMAQFDALVDDFLFYAQFVITNESFDKQVMMNNIQSAIDSVINTPNIGLDPTKLIEKKFEMMGINPISLRKTPEQIQAEQLAAQQQMMMETGAANSAIPPMPQAPAKQFGENNMMSLR